MQKARQRDRPAAQSGEAAIAADTQTQLALNDWICILWTIHDIWKWDSQTLAHDKENFQNPQWTLIFLIGLSYTSQTKGWEFSDSWAKYIQQ